VQVPAQRCIRRPECSGDDLLAGPVHASYAAGDLGRRINRCLGAHGEVRVSANRPPPGHMRQLNAGTPHGVDRADGSREVAQGGAAGPAEKNRGQRSVLLMAGSLIDVQADPPR
jgi:hypothetical protein